MSAARRLALALAFALVATAAPADAADHEDPQLAVDVPFVVWSPDQLRIEVEQRGGLVGRRMLVTVHIDDGLIGGYPTGGERTPIAVEGFTLAPGRHRLLIKSGTHAARATFRYIPPVQALGGAAVLAVAAFAGAIYYRRRKGTPATA